MSCGSPAGSAGFAAPLGQTGPGGQEAEAFSSQLSASFARSTFVSATHDIRFSATDYRTVAWAAGSITDSNGNTYNVASGSTGILTALSYVFFDATLDPAALQVSIDPDRAVGEGIFLIATAENVADTTKLAQVGVPGTPDTKGTVTGSYVTVNTLNATHISSLSFSGKTAVFDQGTIGGWTLAASELTSGSFKIQATNERLLVGAATAEMTGTGIYLGKSAAVYVFRAGNPAGDYIRWDGTNLTVSGAITATSGTIGGWSISAGELSSGSVKLQSTAERLLLGAATTPTAGIGIFIGKNGAAYEFRAGDPAGNYVRWDGSVLTIHGAVIETPGTGTSIGILGWIHTMVFSATDNDTVAWTSGTITLQNGVSYLISAGNTGNISATTYVYLDSATSLTVLQTTTTATSAVGANRILIAVCANVAATKSAEFIVYGGSGTVGESKLIVAANIAANTITANEIVANTLTATQISSLSFSGKTATFDTGSIGGWTLSSSKLSSGSFAIEATNERLLVGSATAEMTGTGIYLGKSGAAYAFRAGDPAGNYIRWDGSVLTIAGVLSGASGTFTSLTAGSTLGSIYTTGQVFRAGWAPSSAPAVDQSTVFVYVNTTVGSTPALYALEAEAFASNTAGPSPTLVGVKGGAWMSNSGNVAAVTGIQAVAGTATGDGVTSPSGTLSFAVALTASILKSGGTITTAVGIQVDSITNGTNNWAIRTSGGWVSFGDDVAVKAARKLYLDGNVSQVGVNTYLWESAADIVSVVTGGTERLRVGSGGDIGIAATKKIYLDNVDLSGDTYIDESSSNTLRFTAGGTAMFLMNPAGGITMDLVSRELSLLNPSTRTTIGANGAASALTALPVGYIDIDIGGSNYQIPYYTRGA